MEPAKIHVGSRKYLWPSEIITLEADWNYTKILLTNGQILLVATTMGIIANRLPKSEFLRINRGTVINRSAVANYFIHAQFDEVKLFDSSFIKISRRRRFEIRKTLQIQEK
jgi:DNA-binding LytR/AlgR family response regulator